MGLRAGPRTLSAIDWWVPPQPGRPCHALHFLPLCLLSCLAAVRLRTFFPPFEDLLQWSYFSIASPLTSPKTLISDPQAGSRINTLGLKSELYPFSCVMRGKGLTSPDFGFLICKKKLRTQPSWGYDGFDSQGCLCPGKYALWLCYHGGCVTPGLLKLGLWREPSWMSAGCLRVQTSWVFF